MSKRCHASDSQGSEGASKRLREVVAESFDELTCAITHELPLDPVTAEDGRLYERSAIAQWLANNRRSPVTQEQMGTRLFPAVQFRCMIEKMVRSGALSGTNVEAWQKKVAQEDRLREVRALAEGGDVKNMLKMAEWYRWGEMALPKDRDQAMRWVQKAIDGTQSNQGAMYARALALAAWIMLAGVTNECNNQTVAICMLSEAAMLGHGGACCSLGKWFANGSHGLPRDVKQAHKWFCKAGSCSIPASVRYQAEAATFLRENPL